MRARLTALLSILFVNSAIVAAYQEETRKSPIKDAVSKRSLKLTIPNDYNDFYSLLQPMLIQRVAGSAGNIKVRNYIKSTMESYGWIVDTQEFTDNAPQPFGAVKFANLIATLPIGKNFQSSQRYTRNRVVFACHYDSKYFSSVQFIGATDSAVPCAMLLDMAKYFHENIDPNVFKNIVRNVQFMFFDGEEAFVQWTATDSTYGSRGLVHYLASTYGQSAFDSIDLFVLLDLLGGQTSKVPNYFPSTTGLAYNKLVKIEANLVARGLLYKKQTYFFTDKGNQYQSMVEDDHIPFKQKNVPILHIIPSPFPAQWHTASDDYAHLDRKNIQDLRLIFKLFFLDILNVDVNKLF